MKGYTFIKKKTTKLRAISLITKVYVPSQVLEMVML